MRTTPAVLAAAAATVTLLGTCVTPATALAVADPPQPPIHITGKVIRGGADGRPHQLICPAPFNAYSGGFTVRAGKDGRLIQEPADLLESRPNDNANGWIVAVRKGQYVEPQHPRPYSDRTPTRIEPADLVIHVVCTQDMPTHGM
ncbi:hypothetical protein RKD23_001719 [Streptomyces sp. SAI-170]|uniref:hypothetical protein n=1 Tax=Streptomyces sp. SAI-170 TaxID=3377729 RepID=UPI003C7DCB0D